MSTVQNLIDACALGSVYALMAVGIGLVFGVLRIVNFAYGQLIMAGAYTLALTNGWNPALSIAMCFVIVIGLSILMDVVVFRPLRGAEPATMLIATFAVSLLLYYIALLRFTVLGKTVGTLTGLNRPIGDGTLLVRWIWVVDMIVALGALAGLLALLNRTNLGLHMRAAAADFRTARMLGVRANPTIMVAVILSGVLAAVVAVLMTAETPYVTPDYALRDTIVVLVGVVVGGMDRLWTRRSAASRSASSRRSWRQSCRSSACSTRNTSTPSCSAWSSSRCSCARTASSSGAGAAPWSAMRRSLVQLAGPVVLIALVGFWGSFLSNARAIEFEHALVFTAIVVGLYVFIGNSGVISFGQIGFFLVGAYAAGELSIPAETKSSILRTSTG